MVEVMDLQVLILLSRVPEYGGVDESGRGPLQPVDLFPFVRPDLGSPQCDTRGTMTGDEVGPVGGRAGTPPLSTVVVSPRRRTPDGTGRSEERHTVRTTYRNVRRTGTEFVPGRGLFVESIPPLR